MRRSLCYLRIAFSATCLIACVLLIALWVRSYYYTDSIATPRIYSGRNLGINSVQGQIDVFLTASPEWWNGVKKQAIFVPGKGYRVPGEIGYFDGDGKLMQLDVSSLRTSPNSNDHLATVRRVVNRLGFGSARVWGVYYYVIPHWFSVLIAAMLAVAPWLRWRFSLRTLLVAITLIAVMLGVVVWASK